MNKNRILIVDDSPSELRILMELLKNQYAIVVATSGDQAIEMVKSDSTIELVLLDVTMPVKDGYETCTEILDISPKLPIIFVSGNDSTEEILKGFDVGGADYLTKPIDTVVASRKVKVILEERAKLLELESEHKNTSDMVMSVMASAGHLGTVLGYLRAGLKITTHEGLISALFDVFSSMNIDACVEFRTASKSYVKSSSQIISPLEKGLLERAAKMQVRFLERGTRYIVNFETVSVIIKNMPVENELARGELRDNLMMIIEDTNALNIQIGNNLASGKVSSAKSVPSSNTDNHPDLQQSLQMAAELQKKHKLDLSKTVDSLMVDFEQCFFKLGLLENQEDALNNIIFAKQNALHDYIEHSREVDDLLDTALKQVNKPQ